MVPDAGRRTVGHPTWALLTAAYVQALPREVGKGLATDADRTHDMRTSSSD